MEKGGITLQHSKQVFELTKNLVPVELDKRLKRVMILEELTSLKFIRTVCKDEHPYSFSFHAGYMAGITDSIS